MTELITDNIYKTSDAPISPPIPSIPYRPDSLNEKEYVTENKPKQPHSLQKCVSFDTSNHVIDSASLNSIDPLSINLNPVNQLAMFRKKSPKFYENIETNILGQPKLPSRTPTIEVYHPEQQYNILGQPIQPVHPMLLTPHYRRNK